MRPRTRPAADQVLAAVGIGPSFGWLAFAGGGRDAGALVVAETIAFAAIVALAVRGGLRWPAGPSAWAPAAVVAAAAAAGVATLFSTSISTSVPLLVEWLWLAALAELVVVAVTGAAAVALLVAALTIALVGQIAWGFLIWFARGDAAVWQLGTFYFPNAYAAYVLLLGAPVVAVALGSASRRRAVAAGGLAVFVLLAIVFSASRTALAIEAAAVVVTVWLSMRCGVRRVVGRALLLVSATAATGFLLTSPFFFPRGDHGIASSLNRKAATLGTSAAARHDTWLGAVRSAAAHPVVGTGPGTFGDVLFRDQPPSDWWSRYAHNQFLEEWSEGGTLLGVAFAAIPVTAVVAGVRRRRTSPANVTNGLLVGVAAAAIHMANDIDWSFPAFAATFVAVAVLATRPFGRDDFAIAKSSRPNVAAGAVALVGLAVLAGGAASHRMRETVPSTVAAVRSRGSLASALAPWSSAPLRWQAGHVARLGDRSDVRTAISLLAEAHRRDPLDLHLLWERGRLETATGERAAARRTFADAIALGRRAPLGYVLAAGNEIADGHPDRAAELLDEGLAVAARQPDPGIRASTVASLERARAELLVRSES